MEFYPLSRDLYRESLDKPHVSRIARNWRPCSKLDEIYRPIRLTQCCTQFKPFGNKTFVSGISISFKCECHIIMQMQYTKNLIPGRFELGTTLR